MLPSERIGTVQLTYAADAGSRRHSDIPGHADDVAYQQAQHRPGRHLRTNSQQQSGLFALHNGPLWPS